MPHISRRWLFLVAVVALTPACTFVGPSPTEVATEMAFCVDEVNRYRAIVGLSTLARSADLEAFATQSADMDGKAGQAHQHFMSTNGGGIARAETELLGWRDGSLHTIIETGLSQMWAEGPAGEHYKIMVGPYTQAGCGMAVNPNGVTVAQDFR